MKHLVVVADDMGKSVSVNRAIAEAHDKGCLTAASIMAGGDAFDDAVKTILERSRLSAGLHITLCDGKAVLPHSRIPDITDQRGNFIKDPFAAGMHYTKQRLLPQIEEEVAAQFERVEKAGIHPNHADGHHHLHMHPLIFKVICRQASGRGIGWIRIPNETLSLVAAFRSPSRHAPTRSRPDRAAARSERRRLHPSPLAPWCRRRSRTSPSPRDRFVFRNRE